MPDRAEPRWLRAIALLRWPGVVLLIALLGYLGVRHVATSAQRAIEGGVAAARELAAGFRTDTITTTYRESLPMLDPEGQGRLTVARLEVDETTRQEHLTTMLWGKLPLGSTVTEIRVPVVYQFEVSLAPAEWRLALRDHTCVVHAPAIKLGPPPSLRTDAMEVHVEEGWLRFDGDERLLELLASLTPEMQTRARHRAHGVLVRANARDAVEEFVRAWLVGHGQWGEGLIDDVEVTFADESPDPDSREEPPSGKLRTAGTD